MVESRSGLMLMGWYGQGPCPAVCRADKSKEASSLYWRMVLVSFPSCCSLSSSHKANSGPPGLSLSL